MKRVALVVLALLVVTACQQKKRRIEPPSGDEIVRGKVLATTLKKDLKAALDKELPKGAASALAVCGALAPAVASSIAREGILVGRATRLPRNPKNAAAGWTAEALTRFEKMKTDGRDLSAAMYARRLPDGRTAYAEPILIQDMCLACHGSEIAPDVKAAIAEKYPADAATGYAVGDLRGLAWVELPARTGAAAR